MKFVKDVKRAEKLTAGWQDMTLGERNKSSVLIESPILPLYAKTEEYLYDLTWTIVFARDVGFPGEKMVNLMRVIAGTH